MADPLKQVSFGRTDLKVTQLGLGTAPLGNLFKAIEETDAEETLEAAINSGIGLIDTAPFYGCGLAEERVGKALSDRSRNDFVLSSKVGRLIREGQRTEGELHNGVPFYHANLDKFAQFDFSYDGVMRSYEESLTRLGVDRIDILHIHDADDHFEDALNGAVKALQTLREEGAISAISAGMNQWEMLSAFADHADFDCFLLAGRYSLLDQSALLEFLPMCSERNIAIMLGGVFNSGLLAQAKIGATFNYVEAPSELVDRAQNIEKICTAYGIPLRAAALQFPLGHSAITTILSGVRHKSEWEDNYTLFSIQIPPDLWEELKYEGLLADETPTPK